LRTQLNRAIFEKVYVVQDKITEATSMPPFDEVFQARNAADRQPRTARNPLPQRREELPGEPCRPLTTAPLGDGVGDGSLQAIT
jgi:hypothetical protein